jgi:hypothetical protein
MPPDHPLQTVVYSADPVAALQALDIDDLIAEEHDHHHETQFIEKALGLAKCRPGDEDDQEPVETIHTGHWDLVDEGDKALGDLLSPRIEEGDPEAVDDYPDPRENDESDHDHAVDDDLDDLDNSAVAWGKAIE